MILYLTAGLRLGAQHAVGYEHSSPRVLQLPWFDGNPVPVSVRMAATRPTYQYGFSTELMLPYRVANVGGVATPQELGQKVEIPIDADPDGPLPIMFPDGSTHELAEITIDKYRQLIGRAQNDNAAMILWKGETASTHHKLELRQRTDRFLLVSLFEQSRQVVQFRVDYFGRLPADPPQPCMVPRGLKALEDCVQFAIPLCEMYAKEKLLDPQALKAARDQKFLEFGIGPRKTQKRPSIDIEMIEAPSLKRPAATMAVETKAVQEHIDVGDFAGKCKGKGKAKVKAKAKSSGVSSAWEEANEDRSGQTQLINCIFANDFCFSSLGHLGWTKSFLRVNPPFCYFGLKECEALCGGSDEQRT